ncbi:hypothetical protein SAMN05660862_0276, partial [Sphingobacterium psychroaquaticum]
MKKIFFLFFIFLFAGLSLQVNAQQKPAIPINTVVEKVQKYFGVYPVEKVHLHFDKPYYAVGDTLWFKTYLNHNLYEYNPSKIVYVEVLTSRDSLIQTLRVPLENNAGKGQLVLDPQFVSQDNYRFRAYTKWMANFDNGYFFNKIVPIGDAINKKLGADVSYSSEGGTKTKATIQFRDRQGNLLGRKKLSWEAIDGWDAFDKGKTETDDMGRVTINLNIKEKNYLKNGRLIVKIDGDKTDPTLVGNYSLSNALWDVDVQFFPEGGELLAGLSKKVAFKALSTTGRGVRLKGKIVDSKKKEVAEFEDLGLGMGYFSFVPVLGEKYKATIAFDNGQQRTFDLPEVKAEGLSLVLHKEEGDNVQFGLVSNDAFF